MFARRLTIRQQGTIDCSKSMFSQLAAFSQQAFVSMVQDGGEGRQAVAKVTAT
jgi:hypothetical protein